MNSGNPLGIGRLSNILIQGAILIHEASRLGWLQSTIGFGERSSSATGYLAEETLDRSNLDVLIGARATKLLQTGERDKSPVMLGLQVSMNASSESPCRQFGTNQLNSCVASRVSLRASREIILAAGQLYVSFRLEDTEFARQVPSERHSSLCFLELAVQTSFVLTIYHCFLTFPTSARTYKTIPGYRFSGQ